MVLAVTWLVVAMAGALLLGGAIRIADRRAPLIDHLGLPADLTVDDVLGARRTVPSAR